MLTLVFAGQLIDGVSADPIPAGAMLNERNFEFDREAQGVSVAYREWLLASRDAKWRTLQRARKAGVKICAGTDAGFMIPHASMNWRELALLVQGGLSTMEALVAATATNADLLGIEAGHLVGGRLADFLLVDGDRLENIAVLADASRLRVFLGGAEIH